MDADTVRITGDLTIKETTKPVSLDFDFGGLVTDPMGATRIGFEGTTSINRQDYGVAFSAALETGGLLVSDKIQLEFELSLIKQG